MRIRIEISTDNGADVTIARERIEGRSFAAAEVDLKALDALLATATSEARLAYGIEPIDRKVGRCLASPPSMATVGTSRPVACSLDHGHTGAHHDDDTGADWTDVRRLPVTRTPTEKEV